MTEKQKLFADEYLIDLNATRAYLSAYPNVKNKEVARRAGSRLLTFVDVQAYINERLDEIHSEKTAEGDAPKVGTLYVPRYTLASIGYKDGDVIRITIEAGEAE